MTELLAVLAGVATGYLLYTGATELSHRRWLRRHTARALQRLDEADRAHD